MINKYKHQLLINLIYFRIHTEQHELFGFIFNSEEGPLAILDADNFWELFNF